MQARSLFSGQRSVLLPESRSLFLPDIESRDIDEMPVPQGFLAFLGASSLFFLKITLILAK